MKHFLSHRFDERAGTLWCGARELPITRKAAALLRCLLTRAGTTVPHETILADVWPDAHVQPENIKVLIRELRLALGDEPRNPRFIRSLPGRGYAFVAPVCDASALPIGDDNADVVAVHLNRGRELTLLADALAAAWRSEACIVSIEAERGMGKTALCDAFLRYASGLPSVRVCYGQCLQQIGDAEPYFAVLDALHHLTRQWPGLLEDRLRAHAPSWLEGLRPWLSDGVSASTNSVIEPTRMIREVGSLMEALGSDGVTVIALDDLQWGDLETIDLLQAVARRRGSMRTVIVATWTPAATTPASSAMRAFVSDLWPRARLTRIVLGPLREEDVRASLISRFGDGVAMLTETLYRLTGGNPLALTSVLDALVASEIIREQQGQWQMSGLNFAHTESLPEPVLDALFWRFAQLGGESRRVLGTAAMVGTTFTAGEVAARAEGDVPPVAQMLDALRVRGFIESVPPARRSGPLRYGFTHPFHAELLVARHAVPGPVLARESW